MRKQYVRELVAYTKEQFIPRLGNKDEEIVEFLKHYGAEVEKDASQLKIKVEFMHFFNAILRFSRAAGIQEPTSPDWSNQLKEFAKQFMFPWPEAALQAAGISVKSIHKSNSYARHKYEFVVI